MTTPFPFDDDLLCAALDDELDDEQRAAFDTDPAAIERLAELRGARDAVAKPVTVPVGARDRAIAAALAARTAASATAEHDAVIVDDLAQEPDELDRIDTQAAIVGTTANVVDLHSHRQRRQSLGRNLSAAAAVVLLAIAGIAVWSSSNDTTSDQVATASNGPTPLPSSTSTGAVPSAFNESVTGSQGVGNQRASSSDTGAAAFSAPSTTTGLSPVGSDLPVTNPATIAPASADVGDVVDATDLQAKVRSVVGIEPLAGVTTNVACSPADPTELAVWSGTATHDGARLSVQIRQTASDTAHIVGLNPDTCTIIFDIAR